MQHKHLTVEAWQAYPLTAQLANIGSEVFRALQWKQKQNMEYAALANIRALELFDVTLATKLSASQFREIARARELWLDFFVGDNQYKQTEEQWKNYFYAFTHAAQKEKLTKDSI